MKLQILGTGCPKCNALMQATQCHRFLKHAFAKTPTVKSNISNALRLRRVRLPSSGET